MPCVRIFTNCFSVIVLGMAVVLISSNAFGQPGGPGGPSAPDKEIVATYDQDGDGKLNTAERKVALKELSSSGNQRRRGRRGPQREAGKPGAKVAIADATVHADAGLFDPTVLRTLFLEFDNDEWEAELAAFKPTDVEVPAKLTVDGKAYPEVGVSFRGASSFFMIPPGLKRSLNLSIDYSDEDQRLYGYKSLNLLNCNGDATMMSSFLYSQIAGQKIATPKVNFVKVVINGESWGLYVNSQQFNKTFLKENFETDKGARWKVPGSPRGDGGLRYLGEELAPYQERFEIKSKDKESSWRDLINLCRVLNETPDSQLEAALQPILDIDGALWFLAVDVALVNSDGYWTRASDYNIYQDPDGKFHVLPHDMNEAFRAGGHGGPPGGGRRGRRGGGPPGGFGGPPGGGPPRGPGAERGGPGGPPQGGPGGGPPRGGGGVELDPLVGLDQERMPLRSKLLSNPKWQRQYLENLRTIANTLKWKNLAPQVQQVRSLLVKEVQLDTRKLFTTQEFGKATSNAKPAADSTSLRAFAEKRSAFLLKHKKIQALGK